MANVILGLLLLRPMSLYDLVRAFEAGVSLFYSASPGSITRALGGLQSRALVEVDPVQPGTRGRKVYRPTPQGRAVFREWMLTEPAESDTDRAILSRLYFLGLLEASERGAVLTSIRRRLEADLTRLETIEREIAGTEIPEALADVARYQRATLDYGIASYRHSLDWVAGNLEA